MFLAVQDHYHAAGLPEAASDLSSEELAELLVSIDSSSIRAHQHAAGARRRLPGGSDLKRGDSELHETWREDPAC